MKWLVIYTRPDIFTRNPSNTTAHNYKSKLSNVNNSMKVQLKEVMIMA